MDRFRWKPGDQLVWRTRPKSAHGSIGHARPMLLVEDRDDLVALFIPAGTKCKRRKGSRGGPRGRILLEWDGSYQDYKWQPWDTLLLHTQGSAHSVWLFWTIAGKNLHSWYVNLEDPWKRTPIGFDTRDHILDLVVSPDLSSWHLKDEDEFEWAIEDGRITHEEQSSIRHEVELVVNAIESKAFPFSGDWESFTPDPEWPQPALRPDWMKIE